MSCWCPCRNICQVFGQAYAGVQNADVLRFTPPHDHDLLRRSTSFRLSVSRIRRSDALTRLPTPHRRSLHKKKKYHMITPLIPTLALSLLSLFCSAFVVLRIVIPILPPHPFSRRVSPVSSIIYLLHSHVFRLTNCSRSSVFPTSALSLPQTRVMFGSRYATWLP